MILNIRNQSKGGQSFYAYGNQACVKENIQKQ